jgi:cytochrome P450
MHLARKEMRVALDAIAERFPGLRLLDPDAALPTGAVLRAPERLPVALR